MLLDGKVALITGSTRGIGFGIAQAYLAEGAKVVVIGSNETSVGNALSTLAAGDRAHGIAADLQYVDSPAIVVRDALDRFGVIDIVVNNAGISNRTDIWSLDAEEWDRVQNVNLRAAFFCARNAVQAMKAQKRGGVILNISSVAGQNGGLIGKPAYVAAKAGMIGLTRSLARQFAELGWRVNCIAPADIDTEMTATLPTSLRDKLTRMTPLGRFGHIGEVASAAVFLASDASGFITGQTLNINGGLYMN